MADQPPPYEYPQPGPYQGTAPPAPDQGYGSPGQAGYPTQAYPQNYPASYGSEATSAGYPHQSYPGEVREKTPLVCAPHTVVIVPHNIVWGRYPVQTQCGNCSNAVLTNVEYVTGTFTWLIAAIILLIGGWLFCFLIPFCADSCKDVRHSCPSCSAVFHTWTRL